MNKESLNTTQPLCSCVRLESNQQDNSTRRMRKQNCGGEATLIRLFYVYLRKYPDVCVCKRICN